jgi:8-oxo-dGTP pyrophosphatase MutT (NUDIX family)
MGSDCLRIREIYRDIPESQNDASGGRGNRRMTCIPTFRDYVDYHVHDDIHHDFKADRGPTWFLPEQLRHVLNTAQNFLLRASFKQKLRCNLMRGRFGRANGARRDQFLPFPDMPPLPPAPAASGDTLSVVRPPAAFVACPRPRHAGRRRAIRPADGPAMTVAATHQPKRPGREDAADRQQYGAIPWRRTKHGEIEVLLITSRERQRWILPKGWPIKGKSPAQAAAREAFEEAGVIGITDPRPIGSYDYRKRLKSGDEVNCSVTLFGLRVQGTLVDWAESTERKRRWHRLEDAANKVADAELATVLHALRGNRGMLRRRDGLAVSG